MITIKFRSWDIRSKKYITDTFLVNCDGQTITVFPNGKTSEQYALFVGVDIIVEQFTGLYDKNGKEIYEGDIVKWTRETWVDIYDEENGYREQTDISFIEYSIEDRAFMIESEGYGYEGEGLWNWNEIEVIGNIYENPELINK